VYCRPDTRVNGAQRVPAAGCGGSDSDWANSCKLILIALHCKGKVQLIEKTQFNLRRCTEIGQGAIEPAWSTMSMADDNTLKRYVSVTEAGPDRAKSVFGTRPLDPELPAVLGSLMVKDLGQQLPLAGKWQQIDLDDGEASFVLVGRTAPSTTDP
jgi:hypothetical protein